MRQRRLILAVALLACAGKAEAAGLSASLNVIPATVGSGDRVTVEMTVSNSLAGQAQGVTPLLYMLANGGAGGSVFATLTPTSRDLDPTGPGASGNFVWVFGTTGCGTLQFSGSASGWDQAGGVSVTSNSILSATVAVTCASPTLTPWIIYTTPTAVPGEGDASIYGNLFKLDSGKPLDLRYSVPFDSKVTISLYNRLGQRIRRIERQVSAGSYSEPWDGRNDSGSLAAAGIYVALFQGKGLFKQVKFAVIR